VEVHAQTLRVAAHGLLRMESERLEIDVEQETILRTGRLSQEIAGDLQLQVGGAMRSEAQSHLVRARQGDIELEANDDVSLDGERVLLNTPRPPTPVPPELPPDDSGQ
jgi:hypothetical protein